MSLIRSLSFLGLSGFGLFLGLPGTSLAAQRTFVSVSGSDTHVAINCSSTLPCRTFGAAYDVTDAAGEIIALDSGGFGQLAISKSISVIAPKGVTAGISVDSGVGVSISAPDIEVLLRGLTITGTGGSYGVQVNAAAKVALEDCVVTRLNTSGLDIAAPATVVVRNSRFGHNSVFGLRASGNSKVFVTGSHFYSNAGGGLLVYSTGLPGTLAVVSRSHAHGNASFGFYAQAHSGGVAQIDLVAATISEHSSTGVISYSDGGSAAVSVRRSVLSANSFAGMQSIGAGARLISSGNVITKSQTGMIQVSGGVIETDGSNVVRGNVTNTSGVITNISGT